MASCSHSKSPTFQDSESKSSRAQPEQTSTASKTTEGSKNKNLAEKSKEVLTNKFSAQVCPGKQEATNYKRVTLKRVSSWLSSASQPQVKLLDPELPVEDTLDASDLPEHTDHQAFLGPLGPYENVFIFLASGHVWLVVTDDGHHKAWQIEQSHGWNLESIDAIFFDDFGSDGCPDLFVMYSVHGDSPVREDAQELFTSLQTVAWNNKRRMFENISETKLTELSSQISRTKTAADMRTVLRKSKWIP